MKKSKFIYFIAIALSSVTFTGCSLFGYDLQKPYDYDGSAGSSNQLNKRGWDYLKSRSDVFSQFVAGVRYAEIDTTIFNRPDVTIFALTNKAITSSIESTANSHPGGYWERHKIGGIKPESWIDYDRMEGGKEMVRQFLLNHIMKGAVSYGEIVKFTKGAKTFYHTMATNGYGYISLHMLSSTESTSGADMMVMWVNSFPSHYTKANPSATQARFISPRSSNLQTNNGAYIHAMDYWLDFPTEQDLASIPVLNEI